MKPNPLEILDRVADTVLAYRPKSMDELSHIANQGDDIYVDSREIATLIGVQHDNFMQLIGKNEEPLRQLGQLLFETGVAKRAPKTGGNPPKFAWLNFDQIGFLLTLSRTTAVTREYRLRLIIMFRNARKRMRPIDSALLTIPDDWRKTFPDDFYAALLHLYGDHFAQPGDLPSWVGKWTNRFIYEPLYNGLSDELKRKRQIHSEEKGVQAWDKLHQFIELHAKKNLEKHIVQITVLLKAATSRQHFLELYAAVFGGGKQGLLGDEFA